MTVKVKKLASGNSPEFVIAQLFIKAFYVLHCQNNYFQQRKGDR
jgi:hypothetical protein